MPPRYLVGVALAALIPGLASAQTETEYYVVQDATSQTCTVVDKRPEPTATNVVQVGPVAFKSRGEAEAGMKTIKVCTNN
jgi:hypothetical protein